MNDLPTTLTYFGTLHSVSQVLNKSALPLHEIHQLNDPFLPDANSALNFTAEELFAAAVKYISHAVLAKNAPRGQPSHPLQKAIARWRLENRFNNEAEINVALQSLLPSMVEQSFLEAKSQHRQWLSYASSMRIVSLYEKFQELDLWERSVFQHKCAAIKFQVDEKSIFKNCKAVKYLKTPAVTVNQHAFVEHMVGAAPAADFEPQQILLTENYKDRGLKEWRLLIDSNEYEEAWIEFSFSLIKSVYLGALVPENTVDQFKFHITKLNPKINLYQATCRKSEFELDFIKINNTQSMDSGDD